VLRAALAAIYAETGETDLCSQVVEQLTPDDFGAIDQDLLVTAAVGTIAACHIGDARLAGVLRSVLGPYEGQLADNGSAHFGDVSHYLAMLAAMAGERDAATVWFERAADTHNRLREWPMLARTWFEHGRVLARTGRPGSSDAARSLLGRSLALADENGFSGTVTAARRELDALSARPP
jgi:hypothetical protein